MSQGTVDGAGTGGTGVPCKRLSWSVYVSDPNWKGMVAIRIGAITCCNPLVNWGDPPSKPPKRWF